MIAAAKHSGIQDLTLRSLGVQLIHNEQAVLLASHCSLQMNDPYMVSRSACQVPNHPDHKNLRRAYIACRQKRGQPSRDTFTKRISDPGQSCRLPNQSQLSNCSKDAVYHTNVNMLLPLHLHVHAASSVQQPRQSNDVINNSEHSVADLPCQGGVAM